MEGLEGLGVGGAEGVSELFVGVLEVESEGTAGKVEASVGKWQSVIGTIGGSGDTGMFLPDQPEETFGGRVLLGLEFVAAEVLDVLGLSGSG